MMSGLEMEAGAVLVLGCEEQHRGSGWSRLGIPTCGACRPGPGKRALQPRVMASAGTWEVRSRSRECVLKRWQAWKLAREAG